LFTCKQIIPYLYVPEDEPSGSKHVEDIVKIKMLFVTKVHFVVLYYTIILIAMFGAKKIKNVPITFWEYQIIHSYYAASPL